MKPLFYILILFIIIAGACLQSGSNNSNSQKENETVKNEPQAEMPLRAVNPPIAIGSIDRLSAKLGSIIPANCKLEIIAEGFVWSEGPVWLPQQNKLLFSDIPRNSIYQWSQVDGLSLYLDSAGFSGYLADNNEPGSNGLLLNAQGKLVLCQHGNRQLAIMNAPLDHPESKYITLVDSYKGKKLNSPNDAVFSSKGDLYFTDPPYGLPQQGEGKESGKELDINGVYKFSASGELVLIDDELERPNGIGLSPDEKTLYVSNSDPENPLWMAYTLDANGVPVSKRIFFDASEYMKKRPNMGLPDGLKVDRKGIIFATGPGGVFIFSPKAELLGIINTEHANGNCALDAEQSTLYINADMYLMRIGLK